MRHQQHRAGRQRHQHADKSEQLAKGQQGKDHGQRMQADALAHQARREVQAFQHLAQHQTPPPPSPAP
jgi:hypothetical protein